MEDEVSTSPSDEVNSAPDIDSEANCKTRAELFQSEVEPHLKHVFKETITRSGRATKLSSKAQNALESIESDIASLFTALPPDTLDCEMAFQEDGCEHLAFMTVAFMMSGLLPSEIDPPNRKAAMNSRFRNEWLEAEVAEIKNLQENGTYNKIHVPVEDQQRMDIIDSKWVYKIKLKPDFTIERFKARLVARGDKQVYGGNYLETHAPVTRRDTFRWLIALATAKKWVMKAIDITGAYLNGILKTRILLRPPEGYRNILTLILELLKGLYGLKQGGRVWWLTLKEFLLVCGYLQSRADPCVFMKHEGGKSVYIAVYVDDITFFGDESLVDEAISALKKEYKLRDLGDLTFCLTMQIELSENGTFLHQRKYIQTILEKFSKEINNQTAPTPLDHRQKFHLTALPGEPKYDAVLDKPEDQHRYQEALGLLNYAAVNTRPDLSTAVSYLSGFASNPSKPHMDAVIRILRYLNGTATYGLYYQSDPAVIPSCYVDAAHDVHPNGRFQIGYIILMCGAPISWRSTKIPSVVISYMEAEYFAISEAGREIKALWNLHESFRIPLQDPIDIYEDNEAVISMCLSDTYTERSKHIDLRHHYIRELVEKNIVAIQPIRSQYQIADGLTKGKGRSLFRAFRDQIGVRSFIQT